MGEKRTRDNDLPRSESSSDFASSGPSELAVLAEVTIVLAVLHTCLPRFLSQIYGLAAVQSHRPTFVILTIGFVLSLVPAKHESSLHIMLFGLTSALWALFMRFGKEYFARDVEVIRTGLSLFNGSIVPHILGHPEGIAEHWIPIVASTVVEVIFEAPLVAALVSMLRQRSRKTRLPAVIPMVSLFALGLLTAWIVQHYRLPGTSTIFYLIVTMVLTTGLNTNTRASLLISVVCIAVSVYSLRSTTVYPCNAMPRSLSCHQRVGNFSVLASTESVTGRILVLENAKYRLMVADHSLLGGDWIGKGVGQSIFSTFYMQSLAIYAFSPPRSELNVLQIGLGIATATKTMLYSPSFDPGHGKISLDVVEIDPKVIAFAHDFFDLPRPSVEPRLKTHAMDALTFVESAKNETYDLISHDIFTGGSLAYPLFTIQFFTNLKSKLTAGGILTVNYVYSPTLSATSFALVTNTLRATFTFVDIYLESGHLNDINNLVFFCSDQKPDLQVPDSGRTPQSNFGVTARAMRDWQFDPSAVLRSPSSSSSSSAAAAVREDMVLESEEVDGGLTRGLVKDEETRMALQHWRFMRDLLPHPENEIWITY